jgi:hypothetical protein
VTVARGDFPTIFQSTVVLHTHSIKITDIHKENRLRRQFAFWTKFMQVDCSNMATRLLAFLLSVVLVYAGYRDRTLMIIYEKSSAQQRINKLAHKLKTISCEVS